MKPSPQLDALIIEKVMGWEKCRDGCLGTDDHWVWKGTRWSHGYFETAYSPFTPSTSIAAAWEVVEKMEKDGYRFEMDDQPREQMYYRVEFYSFEPTRFVETSISMPLTICLAALKAVGVEVGS